MVLSGRSSLIGVAISLTGNVLISLALNCQKLAHIRLEKEESNEASQPDRQQNEGSDERQRLLADAAQGRSYKSANQPKINGTCGNAQDDDDQDDNAQEEGMSTKFLKSRLWWIGISLMTLGEFGNFLCENGMSLRQSIC